MALGGRTRYFLALGSDERFSHLYGKDKGNPCPWGPDEAVCYPYEKSGPLGQKHNVIFAFDERGG